MTKEQIIELQAPKHVKIYRLHLLNLSSKEIAEALKTNPGHVYNALKTYKDNVKRISDAMQYTA